MIPDVRRLVHCQAFMTLAGLSRAASTQKHLQTQSALVLVLAGSSLPSWHELNSCVEGPRMLQLLQLCLKRHSSGTASTGIRDIKQQGGRGVLLTQAWQSYQTSAADACGLIAARGRGASCPRGRPGSLIVLLYCAVLCDQPSLLARLNAGARHICGFSTSLEVCLKISISSSATPDFDKTARAGTLDSSSTQDNFRA